MHPSRSRERPRRTTTDRRSVPRCYSPSPGCSLEEGSIQSKTGKKFKAEHNPSCECGSVEEEDLITLEFKSYSKKASGMPIKVLIDDEMSREKHTRRSSPSLIARLMGLDSLPSPGAFKPPKEARYSSKKLLSKEFPENTTIDDAPESSNDERHGFKDVFEVVQVPKIEKQQDQVVKKGVANSRQHEINKEFLRQNLNDAISRSTNSMPRRCKEIVDSIEALDLKKEIYLPFFQEPTKHLLNLACSPSSPHSSYHSIPMASKGSPTASCHSSFRSDKNVDRYINLKGDDSQSFRKLATNCYSHTSREHMHSLLRKLSESAYAEKDEYCAQPTQIVILKPSLEKARKAERTIPSAKSLNDLQYSLKNNLKFPADEIMDYYIEERMGRKKSLDKAKSIGHKIQKSKENSKEITKQLRNTLASDRQKVSIESFNDYGKDKSSCATSGIVKGKNSKTSLSTSSIVYEYSNNSSHSMASLTESTVTKEARKRLSERWKLSNHFQEMGFLNKTSNTLADMLALSDNETPKVAIDTLANKKAPERKLDREDFFQPRNHPLGISSKDGWKDDLCKSLPRSKSLPASTLIRGNYQLNSGNRPGKFVNRTTYKKVEDNSNWMPPDNDFISQKNTTLRKLKYLNIKDKLHSDDEENTLTEREIHVSSEKIKNCNDSRYFSEKQHLTIELLADYTDKSEVADKFSVPQSNTDKPSLEAKENDFETPECFKQSENTMKMFECDIQEFAPKEASVYHDEDQLHVDHCNKITSVLPGNFNEADQPSPVSVLEVPFEEEEEFATGCFEKISADLHELRMQLQLLKLESSNISKEDTETRNSSDEDTDMLQAFRDHEERDNSYILDMLVDCEVLRADVDGLLPACHSTEYPADLHVFNKLEKKYKLLDSWSRSDRRLLFDLTNCASVEIIRRNSCLQSKMAIDGLVEEVRHAVIKQMKVFDSSLAENLSRLRWGDSEDEKELIVRQVENVIQEELVDELIIELWHL